jgi:CubicO group peptidase (beta-lactamase class C family)
MMAFARTHLDGQGSEMADAIRLCVQTRHQTNRWSWAHLGWMGVRPRKGFNEAELLWHNGGTGGFRSFVGLVPQRRTAVVVLSNTSRSVDARGFDLLRVLSFGGQLRS